jgi:hypothetical protein
MQIRTPLAPATSSGKFSSRKMKTVIFTKTHTIDGITYVKDQPVAFRDDAANALIAAGTAIDGSARTCFTDHCTNAATRGILI